MYTQNRSLLTIVTLLLVSTDCFAGFMGAAVGNAMMANRIDNINDFNKEQSKKLADLEEKFENFKREIGTDGVLSACSNLLDKAKETAAIEGKYATYMAQNDATLLKTPAGFRLPNYRPKLEKLSSFLKTFLSIKDVLDEKTDLDDKILKFLIPPKTVAHMRKLIAQYKSKYLEPTQPGYQPASPQEQMQLAKIENELDALEADVNKVRDGLRTYGTAIGLDIEDLNKNAEDMKDMAKNAEDILEELDKNPLAIKLQQRVVELFSGPADAKTNPFTLSLNDGDTVLDIDVASFSEECATYKKALLDADKKIRSIATNDSTLRTALTTADAHNYFAANMVPPPIEQILTVSNGNTYAYPGYLGFWIQQIVDKLNEIKLAGVPIINARIACLELISSCKANYLLPLAAICPDIEMLPIIKAPDTASLSLTALKKALAAPITSSATEKMSTLFTKTLEEQKKKWAARIADLKKDTLMQEVFLYKAEPSQITPGVRELISFRKTLLLLSLLESLFSHQPFSPKTYTSDLVGPVGFDLFPTLENQSTPSS